MSDELKKDFYKNVYKIALPVTLQSLIMSLLTLTDQLMVGQLGDVAIASVGMATKIYGVISVVLAGLAAGVSIYAAQFWGKQDRKSISQLLGIGLIAGFALSFLFTLLVFFEPRLCLGLFTTDERILGEGYIFLQIISLSYVPTMFTMMYSAILRSTTHVKLPMFVSLFTVMLNIVLNYMLIFGNWGFPELGLKGAAIATLTARIVECALIIGAVYKFRLPGSVDFGSLFGVPKPLLQKFIQTTYPIILTEFIWVMGETAYAMIYSRMGTSEMTAMTITFPLQGICIGLLSGLASAGGVMVGNKLGAGEEETALQYAKRFIALGISVSLAVGLVIAAASPWYVSFFNISGEVHRLGIYLVWVFAAFLWVKVGNMIMAGGILNSGGDSKFVFAMESAATWLIGVPSGLLLSFVFKQPVYLVYLVLSLEEVVRFGIGMWRIHSRKWIKNLVNDIAA
ncbi:MATE family efflux transporter [Paenibacillus faecis]|uniref:MATE family efflux transporter n=1 Tax=Paenibacillus faecis TaxID=862114 RepID=UPI001B0DCCDF|nr:MATE family efflux transporter [Paenibacillus faecis]GIO86849.1 MATE family efflux transporter [Paenibacillus faecis]